MFHAMTASVCYILFYVFHFWLSMSIIRTRINTHIHIMWSKYSVHKFDDWDERKNRIWEVEKVCRRRRRRQWVCCAAENRTEPTTTSEGKKLVSPRKMGLIIIIKVGFGPNLALLPRLLLFLLSKSLQLCSPLTCHSLSPSFSHLIFSNFVSFFRIVCVRKCLHGKSVECTPLNDPAINYDYGCDKSTHWYTHASAHVHVFV